MKIHDTVKNIRKQKGLTQKSMADRLCMARSSYSKLESGSTTLPYNKLISISKILDVPVYEIIKEDGELFFSSLFDKFSLMLSQTYHTLSETLFTTIPYDNLQPKHLAQLSPKGFSSREAYEDTSLGGRIYEFGPKEAFQRMMLSYGMSVLFEKNLIKDEYWLPPLGVAEYQLTYAVPEELKGELPTIEEIEEELERRINSEGDND